MLIAVMVVMLLIAAIWNVDWMLDQRARAQFASRDLAACRQHSRVIESLRRKPTVASDKAVGIQELGERIGAALKRAKLSPSALEGVFPQKARRVGDSPYMKKPTSLSLRNVSLEQLGTFLYHLTEDPGFSISDLRLRSPRSYAGNGTWNAEAVLTYLIYDPSGGKGRDS